ncbi:MAG: SIR2 family protein [Lachnospiraceae bacterium]|nr:SIR2 family protein [Lachnospiraceae bacterium]
MSIYDQIKKLRIAKDKNKLVIFVGAGVSKNSDLPSWEELIKELATEIDYKTGNYTKTMSKPRTHFCSDEYLKIPQYLYNKDEIAYTHFLESKFGVSALSLITPNKIHDIIFELLPAHIITTNYDPLLESSKNSKVINYTVIRSDSEMLENGSEGSKYLIKMHGDHKELDKIVLKEDDYLRYERTHLLLSTFIKSLLVSHTFLFVGYGLNDYNFKQIIDWIEYLAERSEVDEDKITTHYVVETGDKMTDNNKKYLEKKHISVISHEDLATEWKDNCAKESDFSNLHGNRLYAMLKAITDDKSDVYLLGDFELMLLKRYSVFDGVNFIPYEDLLRVYDWEKIVSEGAIIHNIKDTDFSHTLLRVIDFNDDKNKIFEQLKTVSANPKICKYFFKAGIVATVNHNSFDKEVITFPKTAEPLLDSDQAELFDLYLNNDYYALYQAAESTTNQRLKAYWLCGTTFRGKIMNDKGLTDGNKIFSFYEEIISQTYADEKSIIWQVIDKANWLLSVKTLTYGNVEKHKISLAELKNFYEKLNETQRNAVSYLYEIVVNHKNSFLTQLCMKLLEEHQADYDNPNISKTDPWDKLKRIFQRVFCFYKFIKFNYVMVDEFKETMDLFWAFTRAVLYSYKERKANKTHHLLEGEFPKCRVDSFTLDIITKYSKPKELLSFIDKNKLSGFTFSSDNNISIKFDNLCKSFMWLASNRDTHEFLENYCILLRFSDISCDTKANIVTIIGKMLKSDQSYSSFKNYLIHCLSKNYPEYNRLRDAIASLLINFVTDENIDVLFNFLEELKPTKFYYRIAGYVFSKQNNERLKGDIAAFCSENSATIKCNDLFHLYVRNIIKMNEDIKIKLLEGVLTDLANGMSSWSEPFQKENANLIALCLFFNKHITADSLKNLSNHSDYLRYIVDFENFDVECIDTSDKLWIMIFDDNEQRQKLLMQDGKKLIVVKKLKNKVDDGIATEDEKRIYWKYFDSEQKP